MAAAQAGLARTWPLTSQACQALFPFHSPRTVALERGRRSSALGAAPLGSCSGDPAKEAPRLVFWTEGRAMSSRSCREATKPLSPRGVGHRSNRQLGDGQAAWRARCFKRFLHPVQNHVSAPLEDRPIRAGRAPHPVPSSQPASPLRHQPSGIEGFRRVPRAQATRPHQPGLSPEVRTSMAPLPVNASPPNLAAGQLLPSARAAPQTRLAARRPVLARPPFAAVRAP